MNKTSSSEVHFEYTGERYVPKDVTHVQFHPAVTQIEDYAFEDCTKLRQVILNEGLLKIGNNAFHECRVLSSIILPSTVIEIGTYVFYNCYRLLEVELNEGLQKIGFQAFANCNVLQSIYLPSTLIEIDQYAFQKCSSLRALMLNEGLEKLGKGVFDGCTALERITSSSTIKEVDDYSFQGCINLKEVTLNEGIEKSTIGNATFCNCSSLKKLSINGKLGSIGFHAFRGCTALERYEFPSLSIRLIDIIEAGQADIEAKLDEILGIVEREDDELFAFRGFPGGPIAISRHGTKNWNTIKSSLEKIDRLITYYEFKEATVLFELALWKAGIDQADDTSPSDRETCRIEVPGPVKDAILQYFPFS